MVRTWGHGRSGEGFGQGPGRTGETVHGEQGQERTGSHADRMRWNFSSCSERAESSSLTVRQSERPASRHVEVEPSSRRAISPLILLFLLLFCSSATAMDSSRTAGTPDSRLLLPVSRQSLWNPAVSSAKHQPAPDQRSVSSAPPPAAHQSVPGHLSRLHVNQPHLPPPPPAHRPDPPRGYRPGQSFAAPPHIYSTIGAFPAANGHVSSKSNFTNVDSLISKSCPVSLTESRSRPLSSKAEPELQPSVSAAPPLSGHWTPGKSYAQLPHFPIAIPTTYMQPFHQQQRISPKDQAEKKRSSRGPASYLPQQHHHQHQSAVAEVTFASMMCGQRPAGLSLHHQPVLHPNHFQPMSSQSSPLFSATTTHHPLRTSHPLPPHLLPHHLPIEQLPGHQPVAQSPICDMSRVCDNNNCSPLQSDKQARPESQPPDPDNQNRSRRDVVNENSCEVPCSSVSPTNSTTSSSNSGGGGSKFLPKKMWMQKYTYTNQDCPSGGPALLPDKSSPDDLVRENGLIHSNDNSSSSSTSNSQQQHNSSSSGNMNCAASSSNNHIIAASKSKEKVNGASKKKPVPGTKRLKVEAVAADSEATASGSESEAGEKGRRKAGNRGQKRCGQAAGKRAKKVKGDEAAGKTADDATGVASHERDTGDKSADSGKKSWKQSQQVNEDSERTEDEDDEQKQEDFDKAEAAAVSSASCEPAAAAA